MEGRPVPGGHRPRIIDHPYCYSLIFITGRTDTLVVYYCAFLFSRSYAVEPLNMGVMDQRSVFIHV